jgi:hypothetical protein
MSAARAPWLTHFGLTATPFTKSVPAADRPSRERTWRTTSSWRDVVTRSSPRTPSPGCTASLGGSPGR